MDTKKRDRSANFCCNERDLLISLLQQYQSVLENKQNDAATWKEKEAAWETIQREFNARSGGIHRTTKTLKIKYEGLKRTVRKKCAALSRNGSKAPPLDSGEEKIKTMITLNEDDSDILPQIPEVVILNDECETLPSTSDEHGEDDEDVSDIFVDDTPTTSNIQRDVTHRSLNAWEHPALIIGPLDTKKWSKNGLQDLNTHNGTGNEANKPVLDELTKAKLELVQLQKEYLEAEIIEKRKAWKFEENERRKEAEFREKERQWKEELYKLKLKNLT